MGASTDDDRGDPSLRAEAEEMIQQLRRAQGLSQLDLAAILEVHQKAFISQIETGRRRVPPSKYAITAQALDLEPRAFVQMLMRYYEPEAYDILFGGETVPALEAQSLSEKPEIALSGDGAPCVERVPS